MTKARKERLAEARLWYPEQHFTEDSHIVKAYRKRFNVDKDCAMHELCMLGLLPLEKQKYYEAQLAAKIKKRTESKMSKTIGFESDQDEKYLFIAGYTSGGAPYGVTWEEAEED